MYMYAYIYMYQLAQTLALVQLCIHILRKKLQEISEMKLNAAHIYIYMCVCVCDIFLSVAFSSFDGGDRQSSNSREPWQMFLGSPPALKPRAL